MLVQHCQKADVSCTENSDAYQWNLECCGTYVVIKQEPEGQYVEKCISLETCIFVNVISVTNHSGNGVCENIGFKYIKIYCSHIRSHFAPSYKRDAKTCSEAPHPSVSLVEPIIKSVPKMADADLMKVVHCMEHAVAGVSPRKRYSPGWDAKLFWLPLSYMPSCFVDYLLTFSAIPPAKAIK